MNKDFIENDKVLVENNGLIKDKEDCEEAERRMDKLERTAQMKKKEKSIQMADLPLLIKGQSVRYEEKLYASDIS